MKTDDSGLKFQLSKCSWLISFSFIAVELLEGITKLPAVHIYSDTESKEKYFSVSISPDSLMYSEEKKDVPFTTGSSKHFSRTKNEKSVMK